MTRLPSAAHHHGGQEVGLPAGVEQLLVEVVADGFMLYCCGSEVAPNALVACYEWDHCLDLLTIQNFERINTARVPKRGTVDIFAPEVVVWSYEGPPQPALRALLHLVHPAHPEAPTADYPAPASLRVPRAQQRPMTIQPPSPSRAGVRAARLATAMTTQNRRRSPAGRRLSERPPTLGSRRPAGHQPHPEVEVHHAHSTNATGL
ncbi:MAG: hypothetical protein ACRDUV_04960 [Pseudonocardiaceae bacterium]